MITDRPIAFPEIGAMIILQVARALAHAHAQKILHRDIKPENIMIRTDGVVKLMDFGISHMVDLERLTVTGQLLGSPAYMAPEHVEGRPIDFRTDVFAAGIVLYQLTVGKLPFEGRNPHEVLKRIADCKFVDPRQANPRIGNRLGRIILRAMAPSPDARYQAIGEMVIALEQYLDESGLGGAPSELARYFKTPAAYEQALRERLIDHLTRRGQTMMRDDHAAALDAFDRVLTMDPKNARVLEILDGINRRKKLRVVGLAVLGAVVVGAGGVGLHHLLQASPNAPLSPALAMHVDTRPMHVVRHDDPPPPVIDHAVVDPTVVIDAGVATVELLDARRSSTVVPTDAATAAIASTMVTLTVSPKSSEVQVAGGKWLPTTDGQISIPVTQDVEVQVRNECWRSLVDDAVSRPRRERVSALSSRLKIVATCSGDRLGGVTAHVAGKLVQLGETTFVPFGEATTPSKTVLVESWNATGELLRRDASRSRSSTTRRKPVSCEPS